MAWSWALQQKSKKWLKMAILKKNFLIVLSWIEAQVVVDLELYFIIMFGGTGDLLLI